MLIHYPEVDASNYNILTFEMNIPVILLSFEIT